MHLKSPFGDNRKIPESQANKQIHLGLLDPHWRECRSGTARNRNQDESPYAPGNLVGSNLKNMAEFRTDIFGNKETMIGHKFGEEGVKKGEKYVWDGQATVNEAYLKRPLAEVKAKQGEEDDAVDLDKIGPQVVPVAVTEPTIKVIINNPIVVVPAVPPSEPKRAKID